VLGRRQGTSRSLTVYGWLLELYPREYLQQHRAEMLQNFKDLEEESSSTAALWLFIGKDLALSLRYQFTKTFVGQTTIVLLVLAVLLAGARRHPGGQEHSIWGFCYGYALGWFAGWFGKHIGSISRIAGCIGSLPGRVTVICCIVGGVLAAVRGYSDTQQHFVWALCYGCLLGWIAGRLGRPWQARP
jgi:hypothetical protein